MTVVAATLGGVSVTVEGTVPEGPKGSSKPGGGGACPEGAERPWGGPHRPAFPPPTGEKPFECKLCHQRSRDYSAMIKHLRTHNGASPYQCTICTEYCPSLSSMQKHMKGHKPEEIPPDWRIEKTYLYLCYV